MILINGYAIDAALSEQHSLEAELTSYEVEEGSDVTDHQRNLPPNVVIEGIVSDTPIGNMADVRARETPSGTNDLEFLPSAEALARLTDIFNAKKPITIETTLKVYESMNLTKLDVPVDAETGGALRFTATFERLVLVKNNRVAIRVSTPRASGKAGKGNHNAGHNISPNKYIIVEGPLAGTPGFRRPDGTAYEGVRWDPNMAGGNYVDKDGGIIQRFDPNDPANNTTFFDPSSNDWVNTNGTPVTQGDLAATQNRGAGGGGFVGPFKPWWAGGGG